tara:strand:+ start:277 stop:531 length:255 start_codon:yes stop_codon:yes gene_type:complete
MSERITLYQRLKPETKAGLKDIGNKPYKFSVNIIVSLLKSKQFYSDLTINEVKNIIVFSGVEPKTIWEFKQGDFLFEPDLNEAP